MNTYDRDDREPGRFHVPDWRKSQKSKDKLTSKLSRTERQLRSEHLDDQEGGRETDVATAAAAVAAKKADPQDPPGSETRALQETIGTLNRTNEQLNGNLYNIQVRLQEQEKSNADLQEQLRNSSKRSALFGTATADPVQLNQLKNECSRAKRDLEDERLESKKQIGDLNNQYLLAQHKVEAYERGAQRAQELSFKNMSDARWTPRDDATFTNELTELQRSIRDWARLYAAAPQSLYAVFTDPQVVEYLSNVVELTSDGALPDYFTSSWSKMRSKWPSLLLSAVLSYDIQLQFFAHPFFSFDNNHGSKGNSPIPTLRAVYNLLLDANITEGHAWRAQMLRILNPPITANSTRDERDTSKETGYRNRVICENLALRFREGLARHLMVSPSDQDENNDERRKLRDIFMEATRLATGLWTQKSYLTVEGLRKLRERTFRNGSPFMDAHRLHKLDEEDHHLDEQPISIVVHPAILAIGTHDGEGYDSTKPRVLAKAVVWLAS